MVGLTGNNKFFVTGKDNNIGFLGMKKAAADMAVNVGSAKKPADMLDAGFSYDQIKDLGKLDWPLVNKDEALPIPPKVAVSTGDAIYSFTIEFPADGANVDKKKYEKEFQKAVEEASKYGHAVLDIRGHVDPTSTLHKFVTLGLDKGFLARKPRTGGGYDYTLNGKPFDLADTQAVMAEIDRQDKAGQFAGVAASDNPAVIEQAAKDLSEKRARISRRPSSSTPRPRTSTCPTASSSRKAWASPSRSSPSPARRPTRRRTGASSSASSRCPRRWSSRRTTRTSDGYRVGAATVRERFSSKPLPDGRGSDGCS